MNLGLRIPTSESGQKHQIPAPLALTKLFQLEKSVKGRFQILITNNAPGVENLTLESGKIQVGREFESSSGPVSVGYSARARIWGLIARSDTSLDDRVLC